MNDRHRSNFLAAAAEPEAGDRPIEGSGGLSGAVDGGGLDEILSAIYPAANGHDTSAPNGHGGYSNGHDLGLSAPNGAWPVADTGGVGWFGMETRLEGAVVMLLWAIAFAIWVVPWQRWF